MHVKLGELLETLMIIDNQQPIIPLKKYEGSTTNR
nr:MAG TPA: hypothetical protein [Crassvirales sp.]